MNLPQLSVFSSLNLRLVYMRKQHCAPSILLKIFQNQDLYISVENFHLLLFALNPLWY